MEESEFPPKLRNSRLKRKEKRLSISTLSDKAFATIVVELFGQMGPVQPDSGLIASFVALSLSGTPMTWVQIREFAISYDYLTTYFKTWNVKESVKARVKADLRTTNGSCKSMYTLLDDGTCNLTPWAMEMVQILKENRKLEALFSLLKSRDYDEIMLWRRVFRQLDDGNQEGCGREKTGGMKERIVKRRKVDGGKVAKPTDQEEEARGHGRATTAEEEVEVEETKGHERPKKVTNGDTTTTRQIAKQYLEQNCSVPKGLSKVAQIERAKEKSVLGWDLVNTVWIEGIPRGCSEDSMRKKILSILHNFKVRPVLLQKEFQTDLWTLQLSTQREAQELIGMEIKIPHTARSPLFNTLKIVGLDRNTK
eukprot:TRINITY_DN7341_c0_g2_i4.p1 TRINITY_DN7341_c0_g2~~TRINITY_DN7341_c0_g2_i4.p1  ORF type:complete len:366 (-),score=95.87 TRINITY_DN7341_c0_g2_i4:105-1202(-)